MKKAKTTTKLKNKLKKTPAPKKSGEIPVSYAALAETEQNLKHEITSVKVEIRSVEKRVHSLEKRLDSVEKRLDSVEKKLEAKIESEISKVDAKIDKVDAKIETVLAAVHRVAALVEEQNSRNRYVLDGYTSLHDSQEEIKARLDELEKKSF